VTSPRGVCDITPLGWEPHLPFYSPRPTDYSCNLPTLVRLMCGESYSIRLSV